MHVLWRTSCAAAPCNGDRTSCLICMPWLGSLRRGSAWPPPLATLIMGRLSDRAGLRAQKNDARCSRLCRQRPKHPHRLHPRPQAVPDATARSRLREVVRAAHGIPADFTLASSSHAALSDSLESITEMLSWSASGLEVRSALRAMKRGGVRGFADVSRTGRG